MSTSLPSCVSLICIVLAITPAHAAGAWEPDESSQPPPVTTPTSSPPNAAASETRSGMAAPEFQLSELRITGDVRDDIAHLHASLFVRIIPEKTWVRIPAGFDELLIEDFQHVGSEGTDFSFNADSIDKRHWLLWGKGIHELSLDLVSPVRTTSTGRPQLRFTVPPTVISQLSLAFDTLLEECTGNSQQAPLLSLDSANGTSVVDVHGLKKETELIWRIQSNTPVDQLNARQTAPAEMILDFRTGPASLSCTQSIDVSGGSINELAIQLPAGFVAASIKAQNTSGALVVRNVVVDESNPQAVSAEFESAVSGNLTLRYDLELASENFPQSISVSVPDIRIVQNESGSLDVISPDGLLVEPRPSFLSRRIRVTTTTDTRTSAMAFRLLTADSKVNLDVGEVDPVFAVEPAIHLAIEQNGVRMTVQLPVNVIQGLLSDVVVDWKDGLTNQWQKVPGTTKLKLEDDSATGLPTEATSDPDQFRFVFPSRLSGQFLIEFQASCSLEAFLDQNQAFYLPDVHASTAHGITVTLTESDVYSIQLLQGDRESAFPALPVSSPQTTMAQEFTSAWLVDNPDSPVWVELTEQSPEVKASAFVTLSPANSSIHVHEEILFQVRHRDLTGIGLIIPTGVIPTVRLSGSESTMTPTGTSNGVSLYRFEESARGNLTVVVDYHWEPPRSAATSGPLNLPLAVPDIEFETLTVASASPESLLVDLSDDWSPVYSDHFPAAWMANSMTSEVPVIAREPFRMAPRSHPQFAVYRSVISGSTVRTSAAFVFDRIPSSFLFSLSDSCQLQSATVNDRRADVLEVVQDASNQQQKLWQVRIPPETDPAAQSHTIRVVFAHSLYRSHHLFMECSPELPSLNGIAAAQCDGIWIVSVSENSTIVPTKLAHESMTGFPQLQYLPGESGTRWQSRADNLLSPYDRTIRNAVQAEIEYAGGPTGLAFLVAGQKAAADTRFVVVATSARWLLFAGLAVLVFASVHRVSFGTLLNGLAASFCVTAVLWTVVPQSGAILVALFAPGLMLGLMATMLQKFLTRPLTRLSQSPAIDDARTIFAVERPSDSGLASTQIGALSNSATAALPTSLNSV